MKTLSDAVKSLLEIDVSDFEFTPIIEFLSLIIDSSKQKQSCWMAWQEAIISAIHVIFEGKNSSKFFRVSFFTIWLQINKSNLFCFLSLFYR